MLRAWHMVRLVPNVPSKILCSLLHKVETYFLNTEMQAGKHHYSKSMHGCERLTSVDNRLSKWISIDIRESDFISDFLIR
jgi:hypothetical protein